MTKVQILKKLRMEWEEGTTEWTQMRYLKCFLEGVREAPGCTLETWVAEEVAEEEEILRSTSSE